MSRKVVYTCAAAKSALLMHHSHETMKSVECLFFVSVSNVKLLKDGFVPVRNRHATTVLQNL